MADIDDRRAAEEYQRSVFANAPRWPVNGIADAYLAGVKAEREACHKIAEQEDIDSAIAWLDEHDDYNKGRVEAAQNIQARILARSGPSPEGT